MVNVLEVHIGPISVILTAMHLFHREKLVICKDDLHLLLTYGASIKLAERVYFLVRDELNLLEFVRLGIKLLSSNSRRSILLFLLETLQMN